MEDHRDVDERLQHALRQRLDDHLGDDARGLVRRQKLLHPGRQRHGGEQAKGLEEHENIQEDQTKWETQHDEAQVDGRGRPEGRAQVWLDAQVDDDELDHEQEDGHSCPCPVPRVQEQLNDLNIR